MSRQFTKYPSDYVSAAIKKVNEIPKPNRPKVSDKNYKKLIYDDLTSAYNKKISMFELVDDYNIGTLNGYLKPTIQEFTKKIVLEPLYEKVKAYFKDRYNIDVSRIQAFKNILRVDGWGRFIVASIVTQEDGKHAYCKINFDYPEQLEEQVIKEIRLDLQERQSKINRYRQE